MKNHKKWVMGLDIGTASSAVSAYECDEDKNPTKLILLDGIIFSEPIEAKTLALLNQSRRTSRMARRQIDRRAKRRRKLLHIALSLGLDENKLRTQPFANNIHQLRYDALTKKIDEYQLFAVFLHMLQNRGASHLKPDDKTLSDALHGEDALLSQYLLSKKKEAADDRSPWRKLQSAADDVKIYYYARFLIENEFNKIIETQKQHHPFLEENYTDWPDGAFKKEPNKLISYSQALEQVITKQRPLRWDLDTVGNCSYEVGCKVVGKAHPDFQTFRIEKKLADLQLQKWGVLNSEQKNILREKLHETDSLSFSEIYELLDLQEKFTDDRSATTGDKKSGLIGNKTNFAMKKLGPELQDKWQNLDKGEQAGAITLLANLPDPNYIREHSFEQLQKKFAEILKTDNSYPYQTQNINHITTFLLDISEHKDFGTLKSIGLETGRGNYSAKACAKLSDMMQMENCDETTAKEKLAYKESDLDDDINNPIILKAIRQVKELYKETVKKMGCYPEQISLELMRELKQSTEKRNETEKKIKDNKNRRDRAAKELISHNITPTAKNIRRYTLWEEQGRKCAYTEKTIGITELENYEIDHIIPQKKGGSDSYYNLVLADKGINNRKDNHTPYQAYQVGIIKNWDCVQHLAKKYIADFDDKKQPKGFDAILYRKGKLLLSEDEPRGIDDKAMERRNNETAYIARLLTKKLLKWTNHDDNKNKHLQTHDIIPIRGLITGTLRQKWGINTVLPDIRIKENRPLYNKEGKVISTDDYHNKPNKDKVEEHKFDKRCDHRHHLIDAAMIGLFSRAMLQEASSCYHVNGNLKEFQYLCPISDLRNILLNRLTGFVVWQKPDRCGGGAFFEQTLYSLRENDDGEKKRLVARKPLISLIDKNDYDKTIANIEKKVLDDDIKNNIIQQLKEKQSAKTDLKDAMEQIYYPRTSKNLVRRVRCIYMLRYEIKYDEDFHYHNQKNNSVQLNDGYACAMIDENNKMELISQCQFKKNPPRENAKLIFKGDIVFNEKDQKFYETCKFGKEAGIFYKLANETQPIDSIKESSLKFKSISFKGITLIENKGQLYSKIKQLRMAKHNLNPDA